jgi:Protein of unknown function (DUF3592)
MQLRYPAPLQRIWPLAFSMIALGYLILTVSHLRPASEFSRHAVHTNAWYTDLSQKEENYYYAYAVGNTTYSGRALYNDAHSDIYYRKPGDKLEITYDSSKPWVSTLAGHELDDLRSSERKVAISLVVLLLGICSSVFRLPNGLS